MGHLTPNTLRTIDIFLSGDNPSAKIAHPVHTYTTYDDIRGHVAISALAPTPFSRVEISLLGTTRTAFTDHSPPIIAGPHATHIFLRMAMPIPPSAYPPPSGSNDTYLLNPGCPIHIPFHFVVPARVLPHACSHEHSSASVPEAHTQLAPSLGSFSVPRDDLTFELANISYSISARLIAPSPTSKPSEVLSSAIRKFHVVPASEEAPPLLVLEESQYVFSKSKTVRKGLFRGKSGTLTLATTQPRAFSLPPPSTCDTLVPSAPIDLTLNLRFDPTNSSCAPPRLGALSSWIRATTVHSTSPARRIPDQELQGSPPDSQSRAFTTYVPLVAQNVPATAEPLWRVVTAPKYSRRDSGYSSAGSLSSTPSSSSSPTTSAASTGPYFSVSAASSSEDMDGVDEKNSYYTTTIALRLVLPPSRTWIPTFHSCLVSRFYTLLLELVVHPPGATIPFMLSLKVPVQVVSQGREGREEAFVAGGRAESVGKGEGGDMRGLEGVWDGGGDGPGRRVAAGVCSARLFAAEKARDVKESDDTINLARREYSITQPSWQSANPRDGNNDGLGEAALDGGLARTLKLISPQAGRVSDMSGSTSNVVDPLRVIIIGAGIGGLALAQMLTSAPNIQVTLYERNSVRDDGIAGFRVMLSGSTLSMLKRKLSSEVWASLALGIGLQPEGGEKIEFLKGNGDKLFTWDSDPTKDQFSVSRFQLREALLSQTKPYLKLGIAFENYELLPNGGARVHFSDGTTNECDLLVGADGVQSMVKKQLIPYATIKDLGIINGDIFNTPYSHNHKANLDYTLCPHNQYILLATWQNPLAPFATRYTDLTIEPEESYIMLGAGFPASSFHNRRCPPFELTPTELKAELIERTSAPGIHSRFAELAQAACTNTAYVNTVCKSDAVRPWTSQTVTLLGDAVFNMSNTLSRGANCALLDAVSLAECLTSPTYDRHSPASINAYVNENIERRSHERLRSFLMQKVVFPGQNSVKGFVRNMALPLALHRIDSLDREKHGPGEHWVGDDSSQEEEHASPKWVEELQWDALFTQKQAEGKEGDNWTAGRP
ncbi:hypothetical protein V496_06763 [Pseudogymnoascus sp. VKM F-4515 (FW-2607)]|nr:hypothetical protein V496_06763 [Pseudogymnoascus sp. VKM F-4515 (FW-2607)]